MTRDLACPQCRGTTLSERKQRGNFFLYCENCGGIFAGFPLLRRRLSPAAVRQIVNQRGRAAPGTRNCPSCSRTMQLMPVKSAAGPVPLDVCYSCQFVWLDRGEMEALPADERTPAEQGTSAGGSSGRKAEPSQAEIDARLAMVRRQYERDPDEAPEGILKNMAAFLGMPVEENPAGITRFPFVTWLLGLLMVVATIVDFSQDGALTRELGFLPGEPFQALGLTWILSFFLHGGVLHLISNLYFFLIFGDNVENLMSHPRYLLLIVAGTLAGKLAYLIGEYGSSIPSIGASGGISAVLVYYVLAFPRARIGFLTKLIPYEDDLWQFGASVYHWVWFPAWAAMLLWLGLQAFGMYTQLLGEGSVNYLAHVGGAAAGGAFWFWDRQEDTRAANTGTGFVIATKKNWAKKPNESGRRRVL